MKKILFAWLLILPVYGWTMSLSDIETNVRRAVRDTSSTESLQTFSDSLIDDYINEGQVDFVNRTHCLQKSTSVTLSASTTYYSLPNDFISMIHVVFTDANDDVTVLEEETRTKMYQTNSKWDQDSGAPTTYFIYQDSDSNPLEFAVWPIPTSSSTGTVTAYYFNLATDMDSDSDIPFDSYRHLYGYHMALVYYTAAQLKMLLGEFNDAAQYFALYNSVAEIANRRLGEAPNYFPVSTGFDK